MEADRCDLLCLDLETAERIRRQRLDSIAAELSAGRARALGDATRLTLAAALAEAEELCVCDLSLGRRALAEPRLPPRSDAALARGRPFATGGQDGDVLAHRRRAASSSARYSRRSRARVSEQTSPLLQISVTRPLAPARAGRPASSRASPARAPSAAARLGGDRLARRRGADRRDRRCRGRLDRADRFRCRQHDRGDRRLRRDLALHRQPARLESR